MGQISGGRFQGVVFLELTTMFILQEYVETTYKCMNELMKNLKQDMCFYQKFLQNITIFNEFLHSKLHWSIDKV